MAIVHRVNASTAGCAQFSWPQEAAGTAYGEWVAPTWERATEHEAAFAFAAGAEAAPGPAAEWLWGRDRDLRQEDSQLFKWMRVKRTSAKPGALLAATPPRADGSGRTSSARLWKSQSASCILSQRARRYRRTQWSHRAACSARRSARTNSQSSRR